MSEELKFTTDGQDRTPDWSRLSVNDLRPTGTIHFYGETSTEVMRLSRDGVWVNPDLKPDEAAQAVLNALDANIRVLVQRAVETEREECAKVCDELAAQSDIGEAWIEDCAAAIRSRA